MGNCTGFLQYCQGEEKNPVKKVDQEAIKKAMEFKTGARFNNNSFAIDNSYFMDQENMDRVIKVQAYTKGYIQRKVYNEMK